MPPEYAWMEIRAGQGRPVAAPRMWRRFHGDCSDERRRFQLERTADDHWSVTVSGPGAERIDAASGPLERVLARESVAECLSEGCRPPWSAWEDLLRRADRLAVGERLVVSFFTR